MPLKIFLCLVLSICSFGFSFDCQAQNKAVRIKEIGSFYVGGKQVELKGIEPTKLACQNGMTVPNDGLYEVFQAYVHFVKLAKPRARYPLLMWPTTGFSGAYFESTPDGRRGWQMYFLSKGYDTYVFDPVGQGRASWARYPEVNTNPALFRNKENAWLYFRFGPKFEAEAQKIEVYPKIKFPLTAYEQFSKQFSPYFACIEAQTYEAYSDFFLKKDIEGAVVLAHGLAAQAALQVVSNFKDKIKALILIEPVLRDDGKIINQNFKDLPILFVFGDIFSDKYWAEQYNKASRYRAELEKAGAKALMLDLPQKALYGNSHMLMLDTNSDQIADLIQDWLKRQGLLW